MPVPGGPISKSPRRHAKPNDSYVARLAEKRLDRHAHVLQKLRRQHDVVPRHFADFGVEVGRAFPAAGINQTAIARTNGHLLDGGDEFFGNDFIGRNREDVSIVVGVGRNRDFNFHAAPGQGIPAHVNPGFVFVVMKIVAAHQAAKIGAFARAEVEQSRMIRPEKNGRKIAAMQSNGAQQSRVGAAVARDGLQRIIERRITPVGFWCVGGEKFSGREVAVGVRKIHGFRCRFSLFGRRSARPERRCVKGRGLRRSAVPPASTRGGAR